MLHISCTQYTEPDNIFNRMKYSSIACISINVPYCIQAEASRACTHAHTRHNQIIPTRFLIHLLACP